MIAFLAIARGSSGEVRSIITVVKDRPNLTPIARRLQGIRSLAESCARQLTARMVSIESSPVQGKRHPSGDTKERLKAVQAARNFRLNFLRNHEPTHPLYHSREALDARGEGELAKE